VRWLLIQAAVSMLRLRAPRTVELRDWAGRIAARRGKKIAVVALARRLAGILFALLRDGTVYAPRVGQSRGHQSAVPV
jgi:transposase